MTADGLNALKAKYPTFKVQSFPVADCRVCKGAGEFKSRAGRMMPCLCVCMGGDEETRTLCVGGLQTTVKKLRREMEQKA